MKKLIFVVSLAFSVIAYAQDDKTVTLTTNGHGLTQEEAKQNALRNAIEQAFGTFISSNTEILNDELVKDEIVSVSNGNIQKFEILSEIQMQNGEWSNTLKAEVSVTKLTSFCESKGISVEFKGSLFAFNINQQILNEKNEVKAIEDVCQVIRNIADVSFDFTITASDPISMDAGNSNWRIPMYVSVYKNSNFDNIPKVLHSTLKGLSLSLDEAKNYSRLGKKVYAVSIASNEDNYSYILLRSENSITLLLEMLHYFNHSAQNFLISNGVDKWSNQDSPEKIKYIYDGPFRFFLKYSRNGGGLGTLHRSSVFYNTTMYNDGISKNPSNHVDLRFRPDLHSVILDYNLWYTGNRSGPSITDFENLKYFTSVCNREYQKKLKKYPSSVVGSQPSVWYNNQFSFVLSKDFEMIEVAEDKRGGMLSVPGLVISFIPVGKEKKNAIDDKELVRFYYEDIRELNELKRISEYKVIPIKN